MIGISSPIDGREPFKQVKLSLTFRIQLKFFVPAKILSDGTDFCVLVHFIVDHCQKEN